MNIRPISRMLVLFVVMLACGVGSVAHAATPITGCGTISTPGAYQLQNDITISDATCITIATSSVSLDGGGHTITGNQNLNVQAVHANNVSNITVANLHVSTYGWGYDFDSASNILLNNDSVDNSYLGINLAQTSSTTIASSTVSNTQLSGLNSPLSARGIEIDDSASTTISHSTFMNNLIDSIDVHNASHSVTITHNTFTGDQSSISLYSGADTVLVQNNTISNCSYSGFETADTLTNVTVDHNTITGCQNGLDIEDSGDGNTYSNNTVTGSTQNAMLLYSPSNTVIGNTFTGNEEGIDLEYADGNILTGNTVSGSTNTGDYDLTISQVASSTISNNLFGVTDNAVVGSSITGMTFSNNTIASSTQDGLFIQSSSGFSLLGNTFTNILGHSIEAISDDGTDPSAPVMIENNILTSAVQPLNLAGSTGVLVLHNTFRSDSWIYNDTAGNTFNDASTGNTYYLANGTPSWTLYDISDGDNNSYADHGAGLPFDQATLGSTLWDGIGEDDHPYTLNVYVPPTATTTPSTPAPSTGSSSRGVSGQMQGAGMPVIVPASGTSSTAQTPAATGAICTPYLSLTSYIRYGANNDPDQVKKLQSFLNDKEGESLAVDGVYSQADVAAVERFQKKYASEVLGVWGISAPTGYVYRTTLMKINSLNCGATIECPYFTEYNSTTQNASSPEVGKTKELLTELGFYGGSVNDTFDASLQSALAAFQETFSATMLKPWGLTAGTGYKYKTTDKFLNMLVGCETGPVDLNGKGTFDY